MKEMANKNNKEKKWSFPKIAKVFRDLKIPEDMTTQVTSMPFEKFSLIKYVETTMVTGMQGTGR